MSKQTFEAVMKIAEKEKKEVRDLGYKVIKGIGDNAPTLGAPTDPTLTDFKDKVDVLKEDIAAENSPQTRAVSDEQSKVVFADLKKLLVFVNNGPAKGSKAKLLLSNFEVNKEAAPREIPGALVIKKVIDGKEVHSVKVFIESIPKEDFVDRYKVETSADGATWKVVCETGSSRKLIITDTSKGVEIFIRVTGGNTHGFGKPSDEVTFIPR